MESVGSTDSFVLINQLISHLIWPVFILVVIIVFKGKITSLFDSISKIRIADVEAEFEKREQSFAEKEVSPINDEMDGLFEKVNALEKELATLKNEPVPDASTDTVAIKNRIMDALEHGAFRWRSIHKLATLSGAPMDVVLSLLRNDSNVMLGVGKSGRQIAKLKSR